jgi:ABC-type multidrug transport system ATPase subunit
MVIEINSNKLCNERQTINFTNNVLTLVGENGCGKSSILEAVFEKYIEDEQIRTICFSSGQNELFTNLFYRHKQRNRRYLQKEENQYISSFYFNYDWVRVLVFFASVLKPNGKVREFLVSHGYIDVNGEDDVSSKLHFPFRIRKYYKARIDNEILEEAKPDFDFETKLVRKSYFHEILVRLLAVYNITFEFGDEKYQTLFKRGLELNSSKVFQIFTDKDINRIFSFWALATHTYERNIDIDECSLVFKNNMEFRQLSDGEYQLLSIYALIDLFDSNNTIFLFDEIDSHLYYRNLEKLWNVLKNQLNGKVITTTHIADSILRNDYDDLKLIERGKIENELTLRELAKRISSVVGKEKFEFQLASRAKNIVLIDDEDDWIVFKKLAHKKLNEDTNQVFSKIITFKRTSSFNNNNEVFGKGKLEFVKEFKNQLNGGSPETKKFFLICDRDKLSKNSILADLQVNIHNDYNGLRNFNGINTHLLSWKRLEIENYLISYSMLTNKGKIQDLQNKFGRIQFIANDNLDGVADIEEYDAKTLLHPLYKPNGFNETLFNELIALIPTEEISEDIVTMYTFLKNNIVQ